MPGLDEQARAKPPLASDLAAGNENLSANETVTFYLHGEAILPLDGYRFWVRVYPEKKLDVKGSFHFTSDTVQEADQNFTLNRVIFTAEREVNPFNTVAPKTMWIAEYENIMFAFTARGAYYKEADLFHYVGNAVYPDMRPQVVKSAGQLQSDRVIVSNSMPLWLALNNYVPPNPGVGPPVPTAMYPAFLMPPDLGPPWAAVDIPPAVEGIMSAPLTDPNTGSQAQLVTETVKVTLWGLRNDEALTFIQAVLQYSLAYGTFGVMNIPVPRDERRTQSELDTLAQKKTVEFVINYNQATARSIAVQLIETVETTFLPQGAT